MVFDPVKGYDPDRIGADASAAAALAASDDARQRAASFGSPQYQPNYDINGSPSGGGFADYGGNLVGQAAAMAAKNLSWPQSAQHQPSYDINGNPTAGTPYSGGAGFGDNGGGPAAGGSQGSFGDNNQSWTQSAVGPGGTGPAGTPESGFAAPAQPAGNIGPAGTADNSATSIPGDDRRGDPNAGVTNPDIGTPSLPPSPAIPPAAAAAIPGGIGASAPPATAAPTTGAGSIRDTFDPFTGAGGDNLPTNDPNFYNDAGQNNAYYRALYEKYGALNNLGDNFRNYLMDNMARAQALYNLSNAARDKGFAAQGSPTDFLDFVRQGIAGNSGGAGGGVLGARSLFDPNAMRNLMGGITDAAGSNTNLNQFMGRNQSDFYNNSLYALAPGSPLYDWMRQSFTRYQQMNAMPENEQFGNYLRQQFGLNPAQPMPMGY